MQWITAKGDGEYNVYQYSPEFSLGWKRTRKTHLANCPTCYIPACLVENISESRIPWLANLSLVYPRSKPDMVSHLCVLMLAHNKENSDRSWINGFCLDSASRQWLETRASERFATSSPMNRCQLMADGLPTIPFLAHPCHLSPYPTEKVQSAHVTLRTPQNYYFLH